MSFALDRRAQLRMLSLLLILALTIRGEDARARGESEKAVAALRSAGLRALQSGELEKASRSLEAAFRLRPDADGLYFLSSAAVAAGRTQVAKDLARRYLAEAEAAAALSKQPSGRRDHASDAQRAEAQRILELTPEPTGELSILGPAGSWVLLDERLVGRLPLSPPLWVTAGSHQVAVEVSGSSRVIATQVQTPAEHTIELRVQAETGALLTTRVPRLLVLFDQALAATETHFQEAIAEVARREHLVAKSVPLSAAEASLAGCPDSLDCLDTLARRYDAAYVLEVRRSGAQRDGGAPGSSLKLRLFCSAIGELVSARALEGAGASDDRTLGQLVPRLAEVLALGATRPRGELLLHSEPEGAAVFSEGRQLGTTPYRRASWTGAKRLELHREGHTPWSGEAQIEEGKSTTLSIKLQPELRVPTAPGVAPAAVPLSVGIAVPPPAKMNERAPRPRWRFIAFGLAAASGVALIGLGASALAVNGSCSPDTPASAIECRSQYSSALAGGALTGVGGALLIGGSVLALLPGARLHKELAAASSR